MRVGISLFGVLLALSLTDVAGAKEATDACAQAFEAAQLHRRKLDWKQARRELATCKSECPSELSSDCARWEEELERERPVVTLSARDARGSELSGVRVQIAGRGQSNATERPIALDPGRHVIRFVHPDRRSIEQTVELAPGERREVVVVFADAAPARPARAAAKSSDTLPWVLGGVGAAAVGVGIGLGIKGRLDLDELERECSPECTEEQADGVRRTWVAGAVFGAAGGALVLTSLALVVWRSDDTPGAEARVTPAREGIGPSLDWRF